jgi:UDP-GlcNAc:undecaprenyl-phosphate GlcNAc-1-phosphate transferase
MLTPILVAGAAGLLVSVIVTGLMTRVAPKLGFVDKPGGRKIHANPKPLLGGVGIVCGLVLPLLAGVLLVNVAGDAIASRFADVPQIGALISGAKQQTPLSLGFVGGILVLHVMGLIDDRRALGPYSKLIAQLAVAGGLVIGFDLRAMSFLDQHVGGPWLSYTLTIFWITAITNAFNFLDNMDGLSGGVAAVATVAFLITTLSIQQWFVAAALAMLLGALLGFLWWNFPPAKIFMGDSGSLVIGFVLGVLTVRTTFLPPGESFAAGWYVVFAPLMVLALPLYDLIVVSIIRLLAGKSPFVGDTNHFSHRLVRRGMSKRTAVLCLYLVTAATSAAAVVLPHVQSELAAVALFVQTVLVLGVVALLEQHPLPPPPEA